MIKLPQAVRIALPMVSKKTKHQHYTHVVGLMEKLYRPIVTGEKAEHLIQQFNQRESKEAYDQRIRLTKLITPAITNTIMGPARKVPKVKPVVDVATYGVDKAELDVKLKKATADFYSGKGVDHFFGAVLLDQGAIDPNAFCLVLHDTVPDRYEEPLVYPSIISCADAWNFEYFNGELQWLWVHRVHEYEEKVVKDAPVKGKQIVRQDGKLAPKKKKGHAFWLYTDLHHLMFTQVDKTTITSLMEGLIMDKNGNPVDVEAAVTFAKRNQYYYRVSKDELYEVSFYEQASGKVQAFRLGYVPDARTYGETMVSLWNPAMPFIMKGIKAGSELDLSAALHAFLQKLQYANPCRGYTDEEGRHSECNDGYVPGGNIKCKGCKGTGWEVHTSGQDHITMRMPRSKDEFLNLAEMVHYVQLPVEVLTWQDNYVDKLERKCYGAVYNSDRFKDVNATTTTATGDIIDLQSVYDALKPVADWYSRSRVLTYHLIAAFGVSSEGLDKLQITHEFPRNMRFETLNERVNLLKALRDAGASSSSLQQVNDELLEDLYVDDPAGLKKAQTMASFDPFIGKTEQAIVSMISQDLTTKELKVFWTNMSKVFSEAEVRASEKAVNFYDMERTKQQDLLDEIVDELIEEMDAQAEEALERAQAAMGTSEGGDGTDAGGNPGDEEDATGKGLPKSPGNDATGAE